NHHPDHRARMDVEAALPDQIEVHGAVDIAVIDHVVDVPVDVVVVPSCRHRDEIAVAVTRLGHVGHGRAPAVGQKEGPPERPKSEREGSKKRRISDPEAPGYPTPLNT